MGNREAQRRWIKGVRARAAEDPSIVPHGTANGYSSYGCRCARCSEANRVDRATSRAIRRQAEGIALTAYNRQLLQSKGLLREPADD